jgi:hypothetical protein
MTATQKGKIAEIQIQYFGLMENVYPVKTKEMVSRIVDCECPGLLGVIVGPRGSRKVASFTRAGRCEWIF